MYIYLARLNGSGGYHFWIHELERSNRILQSERCSMDQLTDIESCHKHDVNERRG